MNSSLLRRPAAIGVGLFLGPFLLASAANAQPTVRSPWWHLYTAPDKFYFFEEEQKQVVDYKTDRMLRVCLGDSREVVPLRIVHDDSETLLAPGNCIRIEAKNVSLEPAERLESDSVLVAEVETLN